MRWSEGGAQAPGAPPWLRLYFVKSRDLGQQHVLSVRANKKYAAEAYSFDIVDTSGKLTDIMVGSIPEATSGVTACHILALMLEIERAEEAVP